MRVADWQQHNKEIASSKPRGGFSHGQLVPSGLHTPEESQAKKHEKPRSTEHVSWDSTVAWVRYPASFRGTRSKPLISCVEPEEKRYEATASAAVGAEVPTPKRGTTAHHPRNNLAQLRPKSTTQLRNRSTPCTTYFKPPCDAFTQSLTRTIGLTYCCRAWVGEPFILSPRQYYVLRLSRRRSTTHYPPLNCAVSIACPT